MTESEIRLVLSSDIKDAVIKAKASAARMMENVFREYDGQYETEAEYYARIFDDVSEIVRAYILEMQSTAIG